MLSGPLPLPAACGWKAGRKGRNAVRASGFPECPEMPRLVGEPGYSIGSRPLRLLRPATIGVATGGQS